MTPYANRGGSSAVVAFEIDDDSIVVEFRGGSTYLYNHINPGESHVQRMTTLAESGNGLGTYISQHVRKNYAKKLH